MGTASGFDPTPSRERLPDVSVVERGGRRTAVTGVPVGVSGDVPPELGLGREALAAAGFEGKPGQTLMIPAADGPPVIAVGVGELDELDTAGLRDAAAAFATAAKAQGALATALADVPAVPAAEAAQAVVEGVLLARYAYSPLKSESPGPEVSSLTLTASGDRVPGAREGVRRGLSYAAAGLLARDLANSPPSMLNAERMAEVATELGGKAGLRVEVFDRKALQKLGCGGLLGVNAGSADEPRMIKLSYRPPTKGAPHLTLVGKGIMYDSGGISLKPADAVHATMKNDMSGAGAILAAMAVMPELDCPTAVTGYLMCTDNMPSGTATKLGDVLRIRGGTTVEVVNADAEGRLVMADALVLATEEPTDAIVDIATLTGACLRALGAQVAGVFGNDESLVDQMLDAAENTDEPAWHLPLEHRYRSEMDSEVADIKNLGGANGAAIHAALFLEEFVDGKPWAHLDIAGPAQCDTPSGWRTKGCTGFGARLLLDMAMHFTAPASVDES
jgi:leucyl aminopeptidase